MVRSSWVCRRCETATIDSILIRHTIYSANLGFQRVDDENETQGSHNTPELAEGEMAIRGRIPNHLALENAYSAEFSRGGKSSATPLA
jgi:hypothetical protein